MKTVLAYSGGLDTTVLIRILQKNYSSDVVTVYVDVGQSKEDRISAKRRANELGVLKHYEIDAKEEFVRDCLLYTSPSPRDLSTSRMPSSA